MYKSVVDVRESCSTFQTHIAQQACKTKDTVVDLQCRIKFLRDRRTKLCGAFEKGNILIFLCFCVQCILRFPDATLANNDQIYLKLEMISKLT